ncbi:MAG: RsmE family RNA methyltransferase [Candidatus Eisenbacteria bacterium]|uniref:Ribosomal RNA small subunit methyltransferase E n=1 Tax=Eiseniibacteriota bacterium TaxID=2212470 RepID=A0A9D6QIT6_UNCEI|nr:RsmE family RNA methyltransferase [Candidatus Eisenbacteria bacterium]
MSARVPGDAAPSWILVPDLPAAGGRVSLGAGESHYLARVFRARPGDRVSATDGNGAIAALRLIEIGGSVTAEVETRERREMEREAWVLCGAPEGERADWMIEKLAELGVRVLQPLDCERGVWRGGARRIERWRRVAAAALRQSRRAFLLDVRPPMDLAGALDALPAGGMRCLCDATGPHGVAAAAAGAGNAVGLIGPAAGFTAGEAERVRAAGFSPMRLAGARLRTETAAVAWAAWWASAMDAAPGAA